MDVLEYTDEIKPGYARVSDILKPYSNFGKIPPEILENKRRIGTTVHNAIYMHSQGIPMFLDDPRADMYFKSFLKWFGGFEIKFIANELRLYDEELKITGGIDAIIRFPNEDKIVLADWKTALCVTKQTALSWELQGTFYHHLLQVNHYEEVADRFIFIQLDDEGYLPRLKQFEFSTKIMAKCLSALDMYNHFHR